MIGNAAFFLFGCAAGIATWAWLARRRRRADASAPQALPASPKLSQSSKSRDVAGVLRGNDSAAAVERDALELSDELRLYLVDVARQHGARNVTIWRRAPGEGPGYDIVASSREGPLPLASSWGNESERALVAWSAAEQLVGFERSDGEPTLAMCPVKFSSGESAGAVVLEADGAFSSTRDALRDWMPRHAAQVGRLVSLHGYRNEAAKQSRYMRAILAIAKDLQRMHEPAALEHALCVYACQVTGADYAALVRWDAAARTGSVTACTDQAPGLLRQGTVTADSMVGTACAESTPGFWEDATFLGDRGAVLRDGDGGLAAASFAVLPIARDTTTIGALVIGAVSAGSIRALEIRHGKLLTEMAVNALEGAWELAESSRQSRTDGLTGLWNRRHFDEQLKRVVDETDRFGNSCALVICDIDFFKKVNDTYGHDAGDAVLVRVAAVLHDGVRTVDVCARLGGEELALILPQTSPEGAVELAERLRQRIEALSVPHGGVTVRVTVSMGVATYRAGETGKGQLFKRADERLYAAKHGGRNRVEHETG